MSTSYYSKYYSNNAPIYTSRTIERIAVGRRDSLISYGDRMSVRLVMAGKVTYEYQTDKVSDMTDLTGDLRRRAKGLKGLAIVHIRNHDRGWSRELRIMLYGERKYAPSQRVTAVQTPMFFPWEL